MVDTPGKPESSPAPVSAPKRSTLPPPPDNQDTKNGSPPKAEEEKRIERFPER